MEATQEVLLRCVSSAPIAIISGSHFCVPDPKLLYSTATIPIPERVRHKLPLYDHPAYAGGYDDLTFIKVLTCGRQDERGVMVYRIEGDRRTLNFMFFSRQLSYTGQ